MIYNWWRKWNAYIYIYWRKSKTPSLSTIMQSHDRENSVNLRKRQITVYLIKFPLSWLKLIARNNLYYIVLLFVKTYTSTNSPSFKRQTWGLNHIVKTPDRTRPNIFKKTKDEGLNLYLIKSTSLSKTLRMNIYIWIRNCHDVIFNTVLCLPICATSVSPLISLVKN